MTKHDSTNSEQSSNNTEKYKHLACNHKIRIFESLRKQEVHAENNGLSNPDRQDRTNPSPNLPMTNSRLSNLLNPHRLHQEPHRHHGSNKKYSRRHPERVRQAICKQVDE